MKKILLVDDEVQILKALVRLFIDLDYEVITSECGTEALKILEKQEVNMIISDMRMPDMDGYELLSQVKELYPKTVRIILSGYSNEKVIFDSLLKNIAKLYIFKPWDNQTVIDQVAKLLQEAETLSNINLNDTNLLVLINDMHDLPVSVELYQNVIKLIDTVADMSLITAEIEKDISITAKILLIANSAYYRVKTGSVKKAIAYIGPQNIKNMIASSSMIDTKGMKNIEVEMIETIWEHSYLSNRLLNFLYEKHLNKKMPHKYDSAALLHNIGEVFFLKYYPNQYLDILTKAKMNQIDAIALEKEAFSVSHDEVGGYLLQWGDFPYPLVEAAWFHHRPMDSRVENKEIVCAVHIVIKYAMELLGQTYIGEFDERTFDVLGISKEEFEESLLEF